MTSRTQPTRQAATDKLPWLLLDVDGVLSPYSDHSGAWRDWTQAQPDPGFDMPLSQQMADQLWQLPTDIIWLTTWEHEANDVISHHFGWPQLRVLELPNTTGDTWAKLAAAHQLLDDDPRPFVWIDDQLNRHPEVNGWATRTGLPHLLISPKPTIGLTQSDLRKTHEFLTTHSQPDAITGGQ